MVFFGALKYNNPNFKRWISIFTHTALHQCLLLRITIFLGILVATVYMIATWSVFRGSLQCLTHINYIVKSYSKRTLFRLQNQALRSGKTSGHFLLGSNFVHLWRRKCTTSIWSDLMYVYLEYRPGARKAPSFVPALGLHFSYPLNTEWAIFSPLIPLHHPWMDNTSPLPGTY